MFAVMCEYQDGDWYYTSILMGIYSSLKLAKEKSKRLSESKKVKGGYYIVEIQEDNDFEIDDIDTVYTLVNSQNEDKLVRYKLVSPGEDKSRIYNNSLDFFYKEKSSANLFDYSEEILYIHDHTFVDTF